MNSIAKYKTGEVKPHVEFEKVLKHILDSHIKLRSFGNYQLMNTVTPPVQEFLKEQVAEYETKGNALTPTMKLIKDGRLKEATGVIYEEKEGEAKVALSKLLQPTMSQNRFKRARLD